MTLTSRQKLYIDAIIMHGSDLGIDLNKDEFSRAELRQVSMSMKGKKWIPNWITHDQSRRTGRGIFLIPEVKAAVAVSPGEETSGDNEQDSMTDVVNAILNETIDTMSEQVSEQVSEQEFELI